MVAVVIFKSTLYEQSLIIGAGSFSTEVEELAMLLGYKDIAFLDDKAPTAIGTMQDIGKMREQYDTAIVALGIMRTGEGFMRSLKHLITESLF